MVTQVFQSQDPKLYDLVTKAKRYSDLQKSISFNDSRAIQVKYNYEEGLREYDQAMRERCGRPPKNPKHYHPMVTAESVKSIVESCEREVEYLHKEASALSQELYSSGLSYEKIRDYGSDNYVLISVEAEAQLKLRQQEEEARAAAEANRQKFWDFSKRFFLKYDNTWFARSKMRQKLLDNEITNIDQVMTFSENNPSSKRTAEVLTEMGLVVAPSKMKL